MSHITVSTQGRLAIYAASGIDHEAAPHGCLCKNYTCFFATPRSYANCGVLHPRLRMFCRLLNMVHDGDPMNTNSFVSLTRLRIPCGMQNQIVPHSQ